MTIDKVDNSLTQLGGHAAPGTPPRPRVFVLSDIRLLREGVVLALAQQSSVQLVGASDLSTQPRQIADLAPDALLLDITVPGGLDISHLIRDAMPSVKIVALGVAEVEQVVMECAKAGVSGFVAPSGSVKDVVAAVHSAVRGELICSPRTAGMLLSHVSALAARPPADLDNDALTQREREIAQLVSEGLSNKQIARSLGIQSATVKNHVHSILGKLKMRRRVEVAAQSPRRRIDGVKSFALPRPRPNGGTVHNGLGTGPDQTI
jgi:two-component system, NarL family, nitrate/nitrite response regulator NarL